MKYLLSLILVLWAGCLPVVFADDFVPSDEDDLSISANNFILDGDNTGGDVSLQFGATLAEYLRWNDTNGRFELSADLDFAAAQIINVRFENLVSAPTCDALATGRVYFDSTASTAYLCDGAVWQNLATAGGPPFVESPTFLIPPSSTQTISLTGFGYLPSSVVSFPGFTGTINTSTVVSPTQIDVNVTTTATTGTYNVVVDNAGTDNTVWSGNGVNLLEVASIVGTGVAGTYTESFEAGLGSWVNSGLDVAWTRDSGGTPSGNTGPTVASAGTFYLFTESSSPNYPNFEFGVETTDFAQAQSISFDYHMFGANMGTLEIQTSMGGVWTTRSTIAGQQQWTQGAAYLNQLVDLSSFPVEGIRFFYTSGTNYTGDCAIDNVSIIST